MRQKPTVEILKALADDTRLSIIRNLVAQPQSVPSCDIVGSCASFHKLSQPAMSHHFKKLVDAGVLVEEKDGTSKKYRLNIELLESIGVNSYKL